MYHWEIWRGQTVVSTLDTADEALEHAKQLSLQNIFTYHIKRVEVVDFGKVKGGEYRLPAGVTEEPSSRDGRGDRGY